MPLKAWHGSPLVDLERLDARMAVGGVFRAISTTIDPEVAAVFAGCDYYYRWVGGGRIYPVTIIGAVREFPDYLDLVNEFEDATGGLFDEADGEEIVRWSQARGYRGVWNPYEGHAEYLVFDPDDIVMGHE